MSKVMSTSASKDKFLGSTKGNSDLNPNRSTSGGGSGESHSTGVSGKFLGATKGNTDLPPNRSSATAGNRGGKTTQRR